MCIYACLVVCVLERKILNDFNASSSFSRFSKLFCVMGISWIFEILSWYVDGLGFVWYWNIIDVFNILSKQFFQEIEIAIEKMLHK